MSISNCILYKGHPCNLPSFDKCWQIQMKALLTLFAHIVAKSLINGRTVQNYWVPQRTRADFLEYCLVAPKLHLAHMPKLWFTQNTELVNCTIFKLLAFCDDEGL